MNYFAHGRHYVDDPYFLAGTCVPDWLNVVDRRVRARSKAAAAWVADEDPRVAAVARGVIQHHRDDDWFHRTRAFVELSWGFTVQIRQRLIPQDGMRPSFLGHILVELLLDAELIAENPRHLDAYYGALEALDADAVTGAVTRIAARGVELLAALIPRFCRERFLYDYLEDGKLLTRINGVMRRVGLAPIPEDLSEWFPEAREAVRSRRTELLATPS